jgi:hypothetical protein
MVFRFHHTNEMPCTFKEFPGRDTLLGIVLFRLLKYFMPLLAVLGSHKEGGTMIVSFINESAVHSFREGRRDAGFLLPGRENNVSANQLASPGPA